jgi:hypothetical protein
LVSEKEAGGYLPIQMTVITPAQAMAHSANQAAVTL